MAESGLSVAWTGLKQAVGRLAGYGTTIGNWNSAQVATIEELVQSGIRRVYYPPSTAPQISGHNWSWLRPYATLALVDEDYDYDLPDNFGRIIGPFHYDAEEYRSPIIVIAPGVLLDKRTQYGATGYAEYVAIRYKTEDRTTGSRQEAIFYPTPDVDKTVHYSYEAYSGPLSDTYPYPLGGMELAELFIESCLAVTELYMKDEVGIHNQQFKEMLVEAVMRDRNRGAKHFGQMGHSELEPGSPFRRGHHGSEYSISYKGSDI